MAASFEHCVEAVSAAGKIGKAAALDLLQQVNDRAEEMRRSGTADPYLAAASDLAKKTIDDARQVRLDALRSAAVRAEMMQRIESEAEGRVAPGVSANINPFQTKLDTADGLRSILHGMPSAKRKDNVESMWEGLRRQLISALGNRLRQQGLEKAALADGLRNEVAEAMWRMNGGTPDETVDISQPAQQMAESFMAPLRLAKERQNAVGANIGTAVDYVTHTNWDPRQLRLAAGRGASRDAAFEAWKARDVPRMAEKTFDGIIPREGETMEAARERFLRSVYDATVSGVHMRGTSMAGMAADAEGYVPPIYEGTHNLARSASKPRVVYWKNARAWADHMAEFGGGNSLYHDVVRTLDVGARRTALMHYLATNPEANFETVVRRLIEKHRTSDELERLKHQIDGVRNVLGRLDGSLNEPIKADGGELTNQLMALEAMSKLGGVSPTHLSAAPGTFSAEMVHHGVSRLDTIANVVKALSMNRGPAEAQEALADAGAYVHGYILALHRAGSYGEVWRRDGLPGVASWLSAHFMRLTGLPQILDTLQARAVKSVLMARLGRQAERPFGEVEPHQQAALKGYGIGPEEWDLIRGAGSPSLVEGKRWIVPSDALNSDPAAVEALLRARGEIAKKATPGTVAAQVQRFQWDLGDRLLMYLNDAGDHAAVRGGVRERAMVMGRERPGTVGYFVRRAISQFKMWPLAAANQILGREIASALSKKELATNLGALLALSTLGGAMRMAVNDVAMGRPQRDYRNPLTLLAGLAQGGGLGIYGDFLFGETSRFGSSLAATLGGPLTADAERLAEIFWQFKTDLRDNPDKALRHMWPSLAHQLVNHVPFGNLIYLKGALDYLLWYHLFEAASPGWWERTNRRLMKEQGRTMIGYRPGGHIPYTPFGLGQ